MSISFAALLVSTLRHVLGVIFCDNQEDIPINDKHILLTVITYIISIVFILDYIE